MTKTILGVAAIVGLLALAAFQWLPRSDDGGPATTSTASSQLEGLSAKKELLERYVRFRRSYEALEYHIEFRNGSDGGLPSPSEWDIRVAATVPESELGLWTEGLLEVPSGGDLEWTELIPDDIDVAAPMAWFTRSGDSPERARETDTVVGVSTGTREVLYRSYSR